MPLYNPNENIFLQTLDSIFNQTYGNFQLVIVDDSDNPNKNLAILTGFDQTKICHFVPDVKLGLCASLNKAINLSDGDFIARFDADDLYHKERLEEQIKCMQNDPSIDVCSSNAIKIDLNNNNIGKLIFPENDAAIKRKMHILNPIIHPSVMMRRSFFSRFGLYDNTFEIEDYELWLRTKRMGGIFFNIQKPLIQYRVFNSSPSSRGRHWKDNFKIKAKYFDLHYPIESIFGLMIFFFVSLLPYKLTKIVLPIFNRFR